jgi:protoporphyrinogen oxidase
MKNWIKDKKIVIVGAGITGLVIGYELIKRGLNVIILEKDSEIGGLAKTFDYLGNKFDIGPHRFCSSNKFVIEYIYRILEGKLREIKRSSFIYCRGKYFNWPLILKDVFHLNFRSTISIAGDFLFRFLNYRTKKNSNFEEYIKYSYGKTLYKIFFRDLISKFLFFPPEELHWHFAKVGIEKAIIEEKIYSRNLVDLIKMLFKKSKLSLNYYYPPKGIAEFVNSLAFKIKENNGIIKTNVEVAGLEYERNIIKRLAFKDEVLATDYIIWTAPVTDLAKLVDYKNLELFFSSLIIFAFLFNAQDLERDFQWCYFSDKKIIFHRIYMPHCFSPDMVTTDKVLVVAEVSCKKGSGFWEKPQLYIGRILQDLKTVRVIKKEAEPLGVNIEKIENAYPVYTLNYQREKEKFLTYMNNFKNLKLMGRGGLFWYNNMDECIVHALEIVREIASLCYE